MYRLSSFHKGNRKRNNMMYKYNDTFKNVGLPMKRELCINFQIAVGVY